MDNSTLDNSNNNLSATQNTDPIPYSQEISSTSTAPVIPCLDRSATSLVEQNNTILELPLEQTLRFATTNVIPDSLETSTIFPVVPSDSISSPVLINPQIGFLQDTTQSLSMQQRPAPPPYSLNPNSSCNFKLYTIKELPYDEVSAEGFEEAVVINSTAPINDRPVVNNSQLMYNETGKYNLQNMAYDRLQSNLRYTTNTPYSLDAKHIKHRCQSEKNNIASSKLLLNLFSSLQNLTLNILDTVGARNYIIITVILTVLCFLWLVIIQRKSPIPMNNKTSYVVTTVVLFCGVFNLNNLFWLITALNCTDFNNMQFIYASAGVFLFFANLFLIVLSIYLILKSFSTKIQLLFCMLSALFSFVIMIILLLTLGKLFNISYI